MLLDLLNNIMYRIYDTLLESYIYINMRIEDYLGKNKEITYGIIDNKIKEIQEPFDDKNDIIIKEIDNVLHIYCDCDGDVDIVKKLSVALINVTIKIDDKLVVDKLDISKFINNIYIHNNNELDNDLLDNKVWFIIFNHFIDKLKNCDISLTSEHNLYMKFYIINMNGELINEDKFNLNVL